MLAAIAVFALAALALGYPALSGQFLVNPYSDEYIAGYAFREFGASMLRQTGAFPLWNPYLMSGVPFVAGMGGDIFYPTFLLRLIVPTDVAMTWAFIIHVFLAGFFTYLFLRALGLGFFAALIGGLAYTLGGNVAGLASPGHDGKLYVSALMPAALLLVYRGVREGRRWSYGLLAVVVGLAVLSPHPQLLQYMLLATGAFALFVAFSKSFDGEPLERRIAFQRLGLALAAVVVGFAIGAIQYLPVREYVPWSPRAGGLPSYEIATSYSLPPSEIFNMYLPQFTGMLEHYWGRNGIHLHSEYLGAAVLLLAGASFGTRRKPLMWFWTSTLIVTLLWALGGSTPFYRLVYAIVPGTKYFRAPSTILYLVSFCVAVLAALGAERLLAGDVRPRYLLGWIVGAAAIALLASAGALTALGENIAIPERYEMVQSNGGAVIFGAWRSFVFVALAAAALIALERGAISTRVAGWALAAVVAVDLWSVVHNYWMFSPPASVIYASDPTIEYLKRQPEPGRVLPFPSGAAPMAPHDANLAGDGLMTHRIRVATGYHCNEIRYYTELGGREGCAYANMASPQLWSLLNIRYLLSNAQVPQLPVLVGPVKDAAGTTVYLQKLPGDNPAAWVTPVSVKADNERVLATVLNPGFDPKRAALFDTSAKVSAQQNVTTLPPPLDIKTNVTRYDPGHITVRLDAPAPAGSALVVSENYYPGWHATVDGKPAALGRVDYTLIGVELPVGARDVDLRFSSAPYQRGKAITLVALALALVAAAAGFALDRRRRD